MAIGFMPSDEDTDASYQRLNRILVELYDILYHLVHREVTAAESTAAPEPTPPTSIHRRARPSSDSSAPRVLPDLVSDGANRTIPPRRVFTPRSTPTSPSCSAQHLSRTFSDLFQQEQPAPNLDDEVFSSAPSSLSAAGSAPLPPLPPTRQRRRRRRSQSLKDAKRRNRPLTEDPVEGWETIGPQTRIEDLSRDSNAYIEQDTVDSSTSSDVDKSPESESSIISTLLTSSLGGSLWTAVVLMVGWRLLANKR